MKFTAPVFLLLATLISMPSRGWMGIKSPVRPRPVETPPPEARLAAPPAADTVSLSRKVEMIPAGSPGFFLGNLDGVRCFNCAPDLVLLNLGDSSSREPAVLALRMEVWNAIARPLKDRRMFDYANRCFYFGYKDSDTAFLGGEWTEIRTRNVPCYPYLKRTLDPRAAAMRIPDTVSKVQSASQTASD